MPLTASQIRNQLGAQISPDSVSGFYQILTQADERLLNGGKWQWTRRPIDLVPVDGIISLPAEYSSIVGCRIGSTAAGVLWQEIEFVEEGPGIIPIQGVNGQLLDLGFVDGGVETAASPHFATLNPAGNNNDILLAAPIGLDGVSCEILDPLVSIPTSIAVDALKISVTPGTNLLINGLSVTDPLVASRLIYAGEHNGANHWTSSGLNFSDEWNVNPFTYLYYDTNKWRLGSKSPGFPPDYQCYSEINSDPTPIGVVFDPPLTGTSSPTISGSAPLASEIISLINDSVEASALALSSNGEGSDGSGEINAVVETFLSGGSPEIRFSVRQYRCTGSDPGEIVAMAKYAPIQITESSIPRCQNISALKLAMLSIVFEEASDPERAITLMRMAIDLLDRQEDAVRGAARKIFNPKIYGPPKRRSSHNFP